MKTDYYDEEGLPVEMDDYDIECLYNTIYPEEVKE